MTETPIDREELAKALAERARRETGGAPSPEPEELLDYLAGRLAPEAEERVRRQLVADPVAARALLDLAELEAAREGTAAAAGAEAPPPADLAVHAGWRDLQRRLPSAAESDRSRPASGPAGPRRRRWLTPALATTAAALLAVSVGLDLRLLRVERERDRLEVERSRPIADVAAHELAADTRAGGEDLIPLATGQSLYLVSYPAQYCEEYEVELIGPMSDQRWSRTVPRSRAGEVVLFVPVPQPGSYTLRISGSSGCEPGNEPQEVHLVRITRPSPGNPSDDAR